MKKYMLALVAVAMLSAFAANQFGKPKSVIHVVTVKWNAGTTPAQIEAAVKGVEKVAAAYPGIKNVWTKRSEERRVGKECLWLCRSRWSPYH